MAADTTMGGNQSRLPETRRSTVVDFSSAAPALRECVAEALISTYWKPVYKYIRVRWSRSNEDAEDLTQAFFARAFEKEFFRDYDPKKAWLRTYLRPLSTLSSHGRTHAAGRIKRGGEAHIISLDFETAEGELRPRRGFRRTAAGRIFPPRVGEQSV